MGMGRVMYQIKTLTVMIRATFKSFKNIFPVSRIIGLKFLFFRLNSYFYSSYVRCFECFSAFLNQKLQRTAKNFLFAFRFSVLFLQKLCFNLPVLLLLSSQPAGKIDYGPNIRSL